MRDHTQSLGIIGLCLAFLVAGACLAADGDKPKEEAPAKPILALGGNCPVTLVQTGQIRPGSKDLAVTYRGYQYYCDSAEHKKEFEREPATYAIQHDGICIVTLVDSKEMLNGDPRIFVLFNKKLLIFFDQAAKESFQRDPQKYLAESEKRLADGKSRNGGEPPAPR